jgi:hypothetical protein
MPAAHLSRPRVSLLLTHLRLLRLPVLALCSRELLLLRLLLPVVAIRSSLLLLLPVLTVRSSCMRCRLLLCEQRTLAGSSARGNGAAGGHALRQDHCTRTPRPPPISSTHTTTALPLYPACLRPLTARPRPLHAAAVEPCCCGS